MTKQQQKDSHAASIATNLAKIRSEWSPAERDRRRKVGKLRREALLRLLLSGRPTVPSSPAAA